MSTFPSPTLQNVTVNGTTTVLDSAGVSQPITQGQLASTATGKGAALVGFKQNATTAAVRTVLGRMLDWVNVKDFGAIGDGATDDTTAFINCLAYCQTAGKAMFLPDGTYLIDEVNYGHPAGAQFSPSIYGSGRNTTFIKKKTADGNPVFSVNSASSGGYTNVSIRDLTITGITGNTAAGILLTACVRCVIANVNVANCVWGFADLGGITNQYRECIADTNTRGFNFDAAAAPSNGQPNNCTMFKCISVNNTDSGIFFDYGRLLTIDTCDIEGNGTGLGAGAAGITVGANLTNGKLGVIIKNSWIEGNYVHAVQMASGVNSIEDTNFVANSATNDINVTGGTYTLTNVLCETTKAANLLEGAGVGAGNAITNCTIPTSTIDTSKTMVVGANSQQMRGGDVPVIPSTAKPLIQYGSATPTTAGAVDITFPVAYAAAPLVIASVMDVDATKVDCVQISSFTTTGFHAQVTQMTSGSTTVTAPNNTVNWVAIGHGV